MYRLPESLRADIDYEQITHPGGLVFKACKLDLNEVLQCVDTAIKARNDNFKSLLKKIYLHIEKKNELHHRQKLTVEEHFKEMQKLRADARRVNEEKIEAKELYELDIASFKAQILVLEEQISRLNARKQESEKRRKKEVHSLRSTIIALQAHLTRLVSEKQRAEETMNEIHAVNMRKETKKLKSHVREVAKKKHEIEKLHVMQMKIFKTNINRLKTTYDRLYRRFVSKMQRLDKSLGSDERHSRQQVQSILDSLKNCEHQLKISQEHKDSLQEEMLRFDAEYRDLRENETALSDWNDYLQHIVDQKERQLRESKMEINRRQDLDKQQVTLMSKYRNEVESLLSNITGLKEAFKAKQLTLDTLQSELGQYKENEHIWKDDRELLAFLEDEQVTLYRDLQDRIKYTTELPFLKQQYKELNAKSVALANHVSDKAERLLHHKDEMQKKIRDEEEKIYSTHKASVEKRARKYEKAIESLKDGMLKEREKRLAAEGEYQDKIYELNEITASLQDKLYKLHRKHLV